MSDDKQYVQHVVKFTQNLHALQNAFDHCIKTTAQTWNKRNAHGQIKVVDYTTCRQKYPSIGDDYVTKLDGYVVDYIYPDFFSEKIDTVEYKRKIN
jgi:hypothetical protein